MENLIQFLINFAEKRKKIVIIPLIIGITLVLISLILSQGNKIIPFIYTVF